MAKTKTILFLGATDSVALSALTSPSDPSKLVDTIISSIGGAFNFKNFNIDYPHVYENRIKALLEALRTAREKGKAGRPNIVVVFPTGITKFGVRDVPLLMVPLYHVMLKESHRDKEALEKGVVESGERWTIVGPSLLVDGREYERGVRVGVEDVVSRKVESKVVGYTVNTENVGKWIFEGVVEGRRGGGMGRRLRFLIGQG